MISPSIFGCVYSVKVIQIESEIIPVICVLQVLCCPIVNGARRRAELNAKDINSEFGRIFNLFNSYQEMSIISSLIPIVG